MEIYSLSRKKYQVLLTETRAVKSPDIYSMKEDKNRTINWPFVPCHATVVLLTMKDQKLDRRKGQNSREKMDNTRERTKDKRPNPCKRTKQK